MIRPQITRLGVDQMLPQSMDHPLGLQLSKEQDASKDFGRLLFMFWFKLHVPHRYGLAPDTPASTKKKNKKRRKSQQKRQLSSHFGQWLPSVAAASTCTTLSSSLCRKYYLTDRKIKTLRHKNHSWFHTVHHYKGCDGIIFYSSHVHRPKSHSSIQSRDKNVGSTQNSGSASNSPRFWVFKTRDLGMFLSLIKVAYKENSPA